MVCGIVTAVKRIIFKVSLKYQDLYVMATQCYQLAVECHVILCNINKQDIP